MRLAALLLSFLLAAPTLAAAAPEDVPATAPAQSQPAPATAAPPATAPAATPAAAVEEPYPQFGLSLTLGVPDGAVLAFIYSPLYWVAVDVGFAYTLAPGFVIGLEFQPIDFIVFPIVRGEYGYYFAGNTANQIKTWAGVPPELAPLIGDASYNWWSALIGIGIGSRRGFSAKLEGGLTWLSLNVKGGSGTVNNVQVSVDPWKSQAFAPAARLSFQYFF
jgi:hypothetical protein